MPDYPVVDTHLHIWDTGRLRYPGLDDVPLLNRSYLIGDYRQACGDGRDRRLPLRKETEYGHQTRSCGPTAD